MINVKNKKTIATLARKSMKANKTRNIMAVLAIALTTVLFTTLFTIAGTIVNSFEQQTFRQVGGNFHGTFKNVTQEQLTALSDDPLVVKSGARLMLGMPSDPPFNKAHVELSYMDTTCAQGGFCTPEHGALPEEGTNQIACDTRILTLLGVEPKIGATITLPYDISKNSSSSQLRTDSFTLSGWWTYDEASMASHAVVPFSYAEQVLAGYARSGPDDLTGRWDLNVYFKSTAHIEADLNQILVRCGYQSDSPGTENFIATGVNWAYLGAQLSNNADAGTMASFAALLLLIIFTGYLIIYNIFQISVSNDIRFYGLLKTIGTTGGQIRRIILRQAMLLSMFGIPIGLVLGYLFGSILSPVVMSTLSYKNAFITTNPLIFLGATLFSLATVLISCNKPGRIAGKVSPVEAVRYTENAGIKKSTRKRGGGASVYRMALANLGRNRKKTILVVLSLSLAVVLLQVTYTFTNGFDMDKYLRNWVVSDFIVGNADYFQTGNSLFGEETSVPESTIAEVDAQESITESGRIYGTTNSVKEFVTEDRYRQLHGQWNDSETLDLMLKQAEHTTDGLVSDSAQLYGMEKFPLDQLTVIAGDLSALYDPSQNAIAAVYLTNDYGDPENDSQWAKVGDKVSLRYVDAYEYYDIRSGLKVEDTDTVEGQYLSMRITKSHEVTYTVAACVTMRNTMSYRYYGSDEFVLNAEVFLRDSGTANVMTYLFDTTPEANAEMEHFLADYTEHKEPTVDYESKASYVNEFESFRGMFLLMGGTLSGIIGLVGVLNFLNAILTSIITRRREFAMLQSIGMTGRQLKTMLMCEGICYALFAIGLALAFSIIMNPLLGKAMSSMFWFFTPHFTLVPVVLVAPIFLLLGVALPLLAYRFCARQTIVERLRAAE